MCACDVRAHVMCVRMWCACTCGVRVHVCVHVCVSVCVVVHAYDVLYFFIQLFQWPINFRNFLDS